MHQGNCRLCTEFGQLTYEHVPPRVTFNKNTRFKSVPFTEYMKDPINFIDLDGGEKQLC